MVPRSENDPYTRPNLNISREEVTERINFLVVEGQQIRGTTILTEEELKDAEAKESVWIEYSIEILARTFDNTSEARIFERYGKKVFSPNPPLEEEVKYFKDRMDEALTYLQALLRRLPLMSEAREQDGDSSSHKRHTTRLNPAVEVLPLRILKDAIKAVPAVRFALGIAGVGAAVSIVAGFGLDYRVAVFGTLIMIGLMFVLVAFSSFAKDSKESIRPLSFTLSWAFLILTITTSLLLMTSYFFSWPRNLESFIAQNASDAQTESSPWKVKVYDFRNYGNLAREKELGQRFSSLVLDYLLKKQLDVKKGSMDDPLASFFLIPTRGEAPTGDLETIRKLAPVILVYGYVGQQDGGDFIVQTRVSRISANLDSTPLLNESRILLTNQAQMENEAQYVGERIYLLISNGLKDSSLDE